MPKFAVTSFAHTHSQKLPEKKKPKSGMETVNFLAVPSRNTAQIQFTKTWPSIGRKEKKISFCFSHQTD